MNIVLPDVVCQKSSHYSMPYQYINLELSAFTTSNNLLCHYCLQNLLLQKPQQQIVSLRQFIQYCIQKVQSKYPTSKQQNNNNQFYKLEQTFLFSLNKVTHKQQLNQIIKNLYTAAYSNSSQSSNATSQRKNKRLDNLLNQQLTSLKTKIHSHYLENQICKQQKKSSHFPRQNTQFYLPVFSFLHQGSQSFVIESPFLIKSLKQKQIQSIIAQPTWNSFNESIEAYIKIQKMTPDWIGIGLFIGDSNYSLYEQKSKNHITLLSNGWLNIRGNLTKKIHLKFKVGEVIGIKWDKKTKLLIFSSNMNKNRESLQFQPNWNEEVYLCVSTFFKDNKIRILHSSS